MVSLMPGLFLAFIEQEGRLHELTLFVLREALRQCLAWHREGLHWTVAVNVGASDLVDGSLATSVNLLLEEFDLPADALTLDVPEAEVATNRGPCPADAARLARTGLRRGARFGRQSFPARRHEGPAADRIEDRGLGHHPIRAEHPACRSWPHCRPAQTRQGIPASPPRQSASKTKPRYGRCSARASTMRKGSTFAAPCSAMSSSAGMRSGAGRRTTSRRRRSVPLIETSSGRRKQQTRPRKRQRAGRRGS